MMLCIDAGNTRVKWGLYDAGAWAGQGAQPLARIEALANELPAGIERALVANVAGPEVAARLGRVLASRAARVEWLRTEARRCGVANGYDRPDQLGVDRWAALIGARGLHPGPCLVVMAGTATTVDALDASGRFLGGLILPGIELMRSALASNTAQLGLAKGEVRDFPTNTMDAIASGCMAATVGAIERQHRLVPESICLVGGGAGEALCRRLALPARHVENLVLEGLARILISG